MGKRLVIQGADFYNCSVPDVHHEYQTISPSSDVTTAFSNRASVFIGQSEVTAKRGAYINALLCAFDGAYSMRV